MTTEQATADAARSAPLGNQPMVFGSLGLAAARMAGSIVGRPRELEAIRLSLQAAATRMASVGIEGEPGIGKTRLLLAIEELARAEGFLPIAVSADEEIRGPFLLARSIFTSPAAFEAVRDNSQASAALERAADALSGGEDDGLESVSSDRKMVRALDLAATALRALAAIRPLALLVDDMQWADEDSLRLLRYLVRTGAASPILLVLATRTDEVAFVNEAMTLLADMDRLGTLRRLRLARFTQLESAELLQQALGGRIDLNTAATMHAQAEGVPFILAEQARTYREAGLIQQIDGVWTLARNAERLLPAAVKTLIQRRAANLPEETSATLAEAAILGRSFSLRDVAEVKRHLNGEAPDAHMLTETLAPAVAIGLLVQHTDGAAADYSFTHDRIREYAAATLQPPRRRTIHSAIVDMFTAPGVVPTPACMPLLAQHARAAGRNDVCVRAATEAARAAIEVNAPDEALRMIELAAPVASDPQSRITLLTLRDDALGMLRRPAQRIEGLTELSALAEALGDAHLEFDLLLRRASAMRLSDEYESAAELAARVRERAAATGDAEAELAACLELGQDLLRAELGEAYGQTPSEGDLDGAEEAYARALTLAETLGREVDIAAVSRELGVIAVSRIRAWFVARLAAGELFAVVKSIVAGTRLDEMLPGLPIAPIHQQAMSYFGRALEIYERLGDRHGIMSTVIAMAVVNWAPGIHLNGSARHIEEIRRLTTRMKSLTRESERALADAQMLFGAHVYSRTKGFPDAALAKGEETYNAARNLGDRALEFAAAGGVALQYAELAAAEDAERWLDRAALVASADPTPLRALQLASWRGRTRAAAGDADGACEHLEQAVMLAAEQGRTAARCEALAQLAAVAASAGAERNDEALLALAERSIRDVLTLAAVLPGHAPWAAQAESARASIALARGDLPAALEAGKAAIAALDSARQEELHIDILLPAAAAILAAGNEEEQAAMRDRLQLQVGLVALRTADERVRVQWFRAPLGRELVRLAGVLESSSMPPAAGIAPAALDDNESALMRLVVYGHTNSEIAEELGVTVEAVAQQLAELFAKIGVASRPDATTVALVGSLV